MKKILSSILVVTMAIAIAGCSSTGNSGEKSDEEKYGERSKSFVFSYYEGGYGSEWLKAVADDYMENINKDVYIELKPNTDNNTAREKISSSTGTYDLYYIEVDLFNKADVLVELSDLFEMDVPGEAGVKVKDKIETRWLDYYNEDGSYYQMPATNFLGWNWSYNKTLLDETFGAGNYKLPATTNELLEMGDNLFDKSVFLTAYSGYDTTGGADYLRYAYELWFAQMAGLEGYNHYFNGEYNNGGKYEVAKDKPHNIIENKNPIEKTYAFAEALSQGRGGREYMHTKSESLSFLDAQFLQYQGSFKGTEEFPIAFYYNVASAEKEMEAYIKDGIIENQDIRIMKMPVISSIIDRTPTIKNDDTLSKVVDFVDGTGALPDGVSEADVNIVKEARNMVAELVCREFVITKNAQNIPEIKEFLSYLTSDKAQKIAAKESNGLGVLNYGYKPSETDLGITFSEYVKSANAVSKDALIIDIAKFDKKLGVFMGLSWYKDKKVGGGSLTENLYTKQAISSSEIYQSTLDSFSSNWADRIDQYFIQKGGR